MYRLKAHNPTLKLSGIISAHGTQFGQYNYVSSALVQNSALGDFTYIGADSYINRTLVGKFTCIGPGVKIGLSAHPTDEFMSIHPIFYSPRNTVGISFADKYYFDEFQDTTVGNDVWIGADAFIKSGINIGDGAVIASGAVVSKDVPPYSIVGGVPATVIRMRFTEEQIAKLQHIKWWNMDITWLKKNYKLLHSINNISHLIELVDRARNPTVYQPKKIPNEEKM